MAELVASDLTVAVAFGAAGAILVALATFIVALIVDAIGDGDAVGDVQRFIELSAVGRYSLLPHAPLLSDPDGETSAAISQLLAKKEEARRALWGSCEPVDRISHMAMEHRDRDLRLPARTDPRRVSCVPQRSSRFSLRKSDAASRSSGESPSSISPYR